MRMLTAGLTAMILVAAEGVAAATSAFPEVVRRDTGAPELPFCDVCHQNGVTGKGTVVTPFGVSVRGHGAVAGQTASLSRALAAMKADGTDSDGDGLGDWYELAAGRDPNTPDAPPPSPADAGPADAGPAPASTDSGLPDASPRADAGPPAEDLDAGGCATAGSAEGALPAVATFFALLAARRGRRTPARR